MKKSKIFRIIGVTLLCLYALVMIYLMLIARPQFGYMMWNLVPFKTVAQMFSKLSSDSIQTVKIALVNLAGNVIMLVPLGFLLPFAFKAQRKLWRTLLLSFLLILVMETVQLISMRGSFDIDDIIVNLAGVALGYLIFHLFRKKIED